MGLGRENMLITQTGCKDTGQLELWKQAEGIAFRGNSQIQYPQCPTPSSWHQMNKVMFTLEQAMKAHRGSRGIALLFL
jgi:hypothetical protein